MKKITRQLARKFSTDHRLRRSFLMGFCDLDNRDRTSDIRLQTSEKVLQPEFDLTNNLLHPTPTDRPAPHTRHTAEGNAARTVLRQSDDGREPRCLDRIHEASDVLRRDPDSYARTKHITRQLGRSLHGRRAAGQHDTRAQLPRITRGGDI